MSIQKLISGIPSKWISTSLTVFSLHFSQNECVCGEQDTIFARNLLLSLMIEVRIFSQFISNNSVLSPSYTYEMRWLSWFLHTFSLFIKKKQNVLGAKAWKNILSLYLSPLIFHVRFNNCIHFSLLLLNALLLLLMLVLLLLFIKLSQRSSTWARG